MLEEQGQQSVWEFIKKLLNKSVIIKDATFRKVDKSIESHQLGSVKNLVKKNPNMGTAEKNDLTNERANQIAKELKKMHQDFVKESYTDLNTGEKKWKITTTSANKDLVNNLNEKYENKEKEREQKKKSLDDKLNEAEVKANERNKEKKKEMPAPEKHKEADMSL
jgi:hypothetical protein